MRRVGGGKSSEGVMFWFGFAVTRVISENCLTRPENRARLGLAAGRNALAFRRDMVLA